MTSFWPAARLPFTLPPRTHWHLNGRHQPDEEAPSFGKKDQSKKSKMAPSCRRSSLKTAKVCGVCGDRAKSFHFGGLSCDSCKAFFRRSVQNDAHTHFHCPYSGQCAISLSSRKCCQYCRFRKCLSIGMETGWVMTDDERLHLQRLRLDRKARITEPDQQNHKHQNLSQRQEPSCAAEDGASLPDFDEDHLSRLASTYSSFFPQRGEERWQGVPLLTFLDCVSRLVQMAKHVPAFTKLPTADQVSLLRAGIYEMCVVIHAHDHASRQSCHLSPSSPTTSSSSLSSSASSSSETDDDYRSRMEESNSQSAYESSSCLQQSESVFPDFSTAHYRILRRFRCLLDDSRPLVLFLLVILFDPDVKGLVNPAAVSASQEQFCLLLRRFLDWKVGPSRATILFANLLLVLPVLREIKEKGLTGHFRLQNDELEQLSHWFSEQTGTSNDIRSQFMLGDLNNNHELSNAHKPMSDHRIYPTVVTDA